MQEKQLEDFFVLYRRQFINNLLQNLLNRIRDMGCIFIDPGGSISHSIACAGGLEHFNIVVLITEYNTVLCIDMQMIEQIFQCTSFVGCRTDKIYPEVTGSNHFNVGRKHFF